MQSVLSSAAEAEIGALYENTKKVAILHVTLEEMGYPQPAAPVQTDNSTACSIANDNIKQQQSRAIDMRFYWVRDQVRQGQFDIHWKPGKVNLADYYTKHHIIKKCARYTYTRIPAPLQLANPLRQRFMFCKGVLNPHRGTAHCQGSRASRTCSPTHQACLTPLRQHSLQREAISDAMIIC
jgi:hypothetical protein